MPTSSWTRSSTARRLAGATLVGVISGATMIGFSGTAAAIFTTEQTIGRAPASVLIGTKVTFNGKLTGLGERPVRNQPVDLERRVGNQPWSVAGTAQTDDNGAVSIPAKVTATAQWRLHYKGDRINDPDASGVLTVKSVKPKPPPKPINRRIVDIAAAQAGDPYRYGATGPNSFDCSGLTQYVHKKVGISLPRTSSAQQGAVRGIARGSMKPGDLLFFHDGGSVYHVGIYAGGNRMWAATQSGEPVQLQDIWTNSYTVGRAW